MKKTGSQIHDLDYLRACSTEEVKMLLGRVQCEVAFPPPPVTSEAMLLGAPGDDSSVFNRRNLIKFLRHYTSKEIEILLKEVGCRLVEYK